ncbi:MAG: bifunctional phosphoribosylaminoimidazolecarboxamide formyltransferase/IMP cyclohydrolase [Candidatus Pacebacteria bacterium]|nr:bifunctional phosphoribosylaminoimidazolecarboxamide formyltransferase/IMP cyclohydrolase [Candidatus Paceibacterota bacterium]
MTQRIMPRRALISVSDKTGVVEFAKKLTTDFGLEIISTGGTAKTLLEAGIAVLTVESVTGFPEILEGRVKTLHPMIHGGILHRRDQADDLAAIQNHGIEAIDLVVVNLYPFVETVQSGQDFNQAIENIDIGGPSMIRAAAKNFPFVAVLTQTNLYADFCQALAQGGSTLEQRREWAMAAFNQCGAYDGMIASWLQQQLNQPPPRQLSLGSPEGTHLRYGENPHQSAIFYPNFLAARGVGLAQQLQGKELSYNNLVDGDAAWQLVQEIAEPAVVIIKHATPCGVAMAADLLQAWHLALAADPVSAFGGIIACNRLVDGDTAAEIAKIFSEVIIAPDFTEPAREIFAAKKNLRLLAVGNHLTANPSQSNWQVKSIGDGYLVQSQDWGTVPCRDWKIVSQKHPSSAELRDLNLAWIIVKHAKSNAIVLVKNGMAVGIGSGQTSRLAAAQQAIDMAGQFAEAAGEPSSRAMGAVVASDGFFPFADGLETCLKAGVIAAVEPGGALKDEEVIACANRHSATLAFTGKRHFRHG